jgi:hypothetical protein
VCGLQVPELWAGEWTRRCDADAFGEVREAGCVGAELAVWDWVWCLVNSMAGGMSKLVQWLSDNGDRLGSGGWLGL